MSTPSKMLDFLRELTEHYQSLKLECDGLTRVLSYVLSKRGIHFRVCRGSISIEDQSFPLHYWIEVDDVIIDYRSRMWIGENASHGVFLKTDSNHQYNRESVCTGEFKTDKTLYKLLTEVVGR